MGTLVVVLAVVLAAMGAMVLQLRCVDAATEAARLAARGDSEGARRAAARLLPGGADVAVEVRGDDVVARVRAAPLGSALPGVRVAAEARAVREPSPVATGEGPDPLADVAGQAGPGEPAGTAEAGPQEPRASAESGSAGSSPPAPSGSGRGERSPVASPGAAR